MYHKLFDTLESFPPMRESIEQLNSLCKAEEVDILAFAQTIENDPMLFADILRAVNAPFYGFQSEITSIRHALTLFGTSKIHGLALQTAMLQYADDAFEAYGITLQQWLTTMRMQQEFLFFILKNDGDPSVFVKLSGVMFVLEMGRLAANYVMQRRGISHRFEATEPLALLEEERRLLGISGDDLAAALFEKWHFEPEFIELFRGSLHAQSAPRNQKMVALLQAARTCITIHGLNSYESVAPLARNFGLNPDSLEKGCDYVHELCRKKRLNLECRA